LQLAHEVDVADDRPRRRQWRVELIGQKAAEIRLGLPVSNVDSEGYQPQRIVPERRPLRYAANSKKPRHMRDHGHPALKQAPFLVQVRNEELEDCLHEQ